MFYKFKSRSFRFFVALLFLLPLFSSCVSSDCFNCPYRIENIHVDFYKKYSASDIEYTDCRCVVFDFFNEDEKPVCYFKVSFSVYFDGTEYEDFYFSDKSFCTECFIDIEPFEKAEITVNLEELIDFETDADFEIKNVYLSVICYSDGSIWKDEYGIFAR